MLSIFGYLGNDKVMDTIGETRLAAGEAFKSGGDILTSLRDIEKLFLFLAELSKGGSDSSFDLDDGVELHVTFLVPVNVEHQFRADVETTTTSLLVVKDGVQVNFPSTDHPVVKLDFFTNIDGEAGSLLAQADLSGVVNIEVVDSRQGGGE